ncbi:hypothetical protein [Streptomyces sp. NPDC088554]|uniref:hypothetical protein n=1 Tax=Streptomyces sp. NPDC088554 TaxID=3365865 RepID=UPI00380413B9
MGLFVHALVSAVAALCVAAFLLGGEPVVAGVVVLVVGVGAWRVARASRPRTRPKPRSAEWRGSCGRARCGARETRKPYEVGEAYKVRGRTTSGRPGNRTTPHGRGRGGSCG